MIFATLRQLEETSSWADPDGRRMIGFHVKETSETEPLVCLRHFGPEMNPIGAYRKNKLN